MVKLANASKMLALGAIVSLSTMAVNVASVAAAPVCSNVKDNLCVNWDGKGTFTIYPQGRSFSALQLHASSYVITNPDYKGGDFTTAGKAAYPQSLYGTTQTINLVAGSSVPVTVNVPYSPCGNVQVDLYDGPEVVTVGSNGHGTQYIAGNIIQPFNTVVCGGGQGAGPTTPDTPATPVVVTPAAAVVAPTLSDTGLNIRLTSVLAAAFIVAAGYVFTRRNKISE